MALSLTKQASSFREKFTKPFRVTAQIAKILPANLHLTITPI